MDSKLTMQAACGTPYLLKSIWNGTSDVHVFGKAGNVANVEPLVPLKLMEALTPAHAFLDIGGNVGAYSLMAMQRTGRVLYVEMQPGCVARFRCSLGRLGPDAVHPEILHGFVHSDAAAQDIRVPPDACGVMASPSAVLGRWPHGLELKAGRLLRKQSAELVRAQTVSVSRLDLILRIPSAPLVVKVDTEGYEIHVLQQLKPVWGRIDAAVIEFQPSAWEHAGIGWDVGVRVVAEFAGGFCRVASLPHMERQTRSWRRAFPRGARDWMSGTVAQLDTTFRVHNVTEFLDRKHLRRGQFKELLFGAC